MLRKVILPRVRSKGDISTVTLSPSRTLMLFFLSLPPRVHCTSAPLLSITFHTLRACSITSPSSSITFWSSFFAFEASTCAILFCASLCSLNFSFLLTCRATAVGALARRRRPANPP